MISLNLLFPFSVFDCPWLAPAALLLDLIFGDPLLPWPHPVCLLGKLINMLEKPARTFAATGNSLAAKSARAILAGALCLLTACGMAWLVSLFFCLLPFLGFLFALYFAWAGLAAGCLLSTGALVFERIEHGSLTEAREAASWLVSRDTSQMEKGLLRKTLADTMAENYTDAFTAPFFWLCLGGPCALWIYKAASTMDSQWGYVTSQWKSLGYACAKADDALAWLPARISALLLLITDRLCRLARRAIWQGDWPGFSTIARQAKTMTSPNSGWSMTACAWLCAGRMAGPSVYFGKLVRKGWLGPAHAAANKWDKKLLGHLFALLRMAFICGGLIIWLTFIFTSFVFSWLQGAAC